MAQKGRKSELKLFIETAYYYQQKQLFFQANAAKLKNKAYLSLTTMGGWMATVMTKIQTQSTPENRKGK